MGISVYSRLMVGALWSDLYREEQLTKTVTKYNPDTGEPYSVEQDAGRRFWLCGIESVEWSDPQSWARTVGLEAHECKDDGKWVTIIGILLAGGNMNSGRLGARRFTVAELERHVEAVRARLVAVGYTGPVSIWHLFHVSC